MTETTEPDPTAGKSVSRWKMPLGEFKDIAVRAVKEASADNIGLISAGVGFYGFLAMVPLLGAMVLIYGLVAEPKTVIQHMHALTTMLPKDVAKLIGRQLLNVVQTSGTKKGLGLLMALAIALFGARNAAGAVITALNVAYEEKERRSFIQVTLLALAITAAAVMGMVLAMLGIAALGFLQTIIPASPLLVTLGKVLSYIALALIAAAGAATLYRFAPSHDDPKWTWLTPGSVLFALAWTVLTLGFGFYVSHFGNYGATYGSLSAVVVLLTWLYLSSYALLLGGELNFEFEQKTAPAKPEIAAKPGEAVSNRPTDRVPPFAPGSTPAARRILPSAPRPRPAFGRQFAAALGSVLAALAGVNALRHGIRPAARLGS